MDAPLISCQRYLDNNLVKRKALTFKVFIVTVFEVELRGKKYRIILDGHHNLAAAKLAGKPVTWKGPSKKYMRIIKKYSQDQLEKFLINNLTDSDHYFVDNGEIVEDLIQPA